MYPRLTHGLESAGRVFTSTVRGTGSTAFTIIGALGLGFGVPLFWVWVASVAAGSERTVTTSLALFLAIALIGSYFVLLLIAGWVRGRLIDEGEMKMRRASWNRSMRDEPFRPGHSKSDPIERIFILAAILGFVAFEIWFAFFAGSPFGSS